MSRASKQGTTVRVKVLMRGTVEKLVDGHLKAEHYEQTFTVAGPTLERAKAMAAKKAAKEAMEILNFELAD